MGSNSQRRPTGILLITSTEIYSSAKVENIILKEISITALTIKIKQCANNTYLSQRLVQC